MVLLLNKPLPKEIKDFIHENYTEDQIEEFGDLEELSRYHVKQICYLSQGKLDCLKEYNPFDIVSKDKAKVSRSISQLFYSDNNNSRFFTQGVPTEINEADCEILTEILLESGMLQIITQYQSSDITDICEVVEVYKSLVHDAKQDHYQYIVNSFETYYDRHNDVEIGYSEIEKKWNLVVDWVVAETFKNAGMMIKFVTSSDHQTNSYKVLNACLIDLDTRYVTKLEKYKNEHVKYFKEYFKYILKVKE